MERLYTFGDVRAPLPYIQYSADQRYLIVEPGVESDFYKMDNPVQDDTSTRVLALQTSTNRFIWKAAPSGPIVGSVNDFAEFFALMPGDNAATIAIDAPLLLPQNGPTQGSSVTRLSSSSVYAEFYALMPGDNAATIAIDAPILFPQNGETSGTGVTRVSTSSFQLAAAGTYEVSWQASVTEAAQVVLWVDAGTVAGAGAAPAKISRTVVGRATGTNQISGRTYIRTTAINTAISVRNGASAGALTMTPVAGGTDPVSANITIRQLA